MASYTFVASRDPVDGDDLVHSLSQQLATAGNEVTLFLVENGTFLARAGVREDLCAELTAAGVSILADEQALLERGIAASDPVRSASLDILVDHLAAGRKVSWH